MFSRVGVLLGASVLLATSGLASAQRAQPAPPPAPAPTVAVESSAWIGIGIKERGRAGVPVTAVWEPALSAGVLEGDEVLSVDRVRVPTSNDLISVIRRHKAGSKVTLELLRGDKTISLAVTLDQKPTNSELVQRLLLDKPAPPLARPRFEHADTDELIARRGEVVVVAVFHPSCTSCDPVFTQLAALSRDPSLDVSIVGASLGSIDSAGSFAKYRGLPFDVVAIDDETRTRWGLFDVTTPVIAVVDPRGVVRYAGAIDGGQSPEAVLRAVAVETDQAIFAAGRLARAKRR